MSPASYRTAPPRVAVTLQASGPPDANRSRPSVTAASCCRYDRRRGRRRAAATPASAAAAPRRLVLLLVATDAFARSRPAASVGLAVGGEVAFPQRLPDPLRRFRGVLQRLGEVGCSPAAAALSPRPLRLSSARRRGPRPREDVVQRLLEGVLDSDLVAEATPGPAAAAGRTSAPRGLRRRPARRRAARQRRQRQQVAVGHLGRALRGAASHATSASDSKVFCTCPGPLICGAPRQLAGRASVP